MEVYEITGYKTGVSDAGVNYLQPADSFQNILNGFIYRDVLQSRQGFGYFAPRLDDETRVFGIFEHTLPDSTKELLAVDQNFLYKYNIGTGVFDQIPFGGSLAAYPGFNIPAKDRYISGTSYPTKTNGPRFVFCGSGITPNLPGGSAIFYYDGTNVLDFTVDNADFADPPGGDLLSATFVIWFNERLNFIIPIIAGITYNQGVLYSGIRTTSGNGDKFNVPGSGLFQADTYQNITGATILGQILSINYDRMAYTMEKTRDAFNPYFGRAIPGVVGTNAKFSPVSWDDVTKSMGKVGIVGVDGRRNLKVDNKIPNFTRTQMDQKNFNLTYGGFDRTNNQFLWSYLSPESSSLTQDRTLVSNYEEDTWSVYDWRFSVFGQTDLGIDLTWDDINETSGNASWSRWDTTEEIWDEIGLGEAVQKTLAGDDLGFIYELNKDFDDFISLITAIVAGATTVLTVDATGILAGDLVSISNVGGMIELNNYDTETNELTNNLYVVLAATPTSIEINVDSSMFTAFTSGGTISKVINFYAETIPFNPYRSLGLRCYVGMVEFYIDNNGGSLKVDVFSNEEESPFIQDVLIKPNTATQARQWVSMGVNQEADFLTFALKQQSPGVQMRLTNMRIHCMPGGPTSG